MHVSVRSPSTLNSYSLLSRDGYKLLQQNYGIDFPFGTLSSQKTAKSWGDSISVVRIVVVDTT